MILFSYFMARPDKIRKMWDLEKSLGINPEDFYGDEHFHPYSDVMIKRRMRKHNLEQETENFTGESFGVVVYDPKKDEIYTKK